LFTEIKSPIHNPKYYIIAGEASGDLHGSNLESFIKKDSTADIRFGVVI
jgi:lipid A disaccharide synthetase